MSSSSAGQSLSDGPFIMHAIKMLEPNWWTIGFAVIVQLALFVRWLYRRIRNDELLQIFVEDMATSHLPHIYELLLKLCEQQGIERLPRPSIRWVDVDKNRRR
jgi:hypothetical protein